MRKGVAALAAVACVGVAAFAAVQPAAAARGPLPPSYRVYAAPPQLGNDAGEPSLGVGSSGQVMFQAGYETLNVSNFDRAFPGDAIWRDVSSAYTSLMTLDPMLETDAATGRTWVSQLVGACSLLAYTDSRGESWKNVPLGCGEGSMFDHQNIGSGPYVKGGPLALAPHTYPDVVYYCAQDIAAATCAPSIDGGDTFLTANTVYTSAQCELGTLFGHLKTAPDGTAYLPPKYCPDLLGGTFRTGVAVSEDNGLTWNLRLVPGSEYGDAGHGSVAVGSDGTVYLAWGSGKFAYNGGPVQVAVSHDKGRTWTKPVSLGTSFGIANSRFPVAVAGDGDRAVVAYLGTATGGDAGATAFAGVWHLYASHTYDGGRTWQTVDVTPDNPVQVGSICTSGTTCGSDRNLLDFNDMVVDQFGRPYIAFADGCTVARYDCTKNVRESHATIARLTGGRGVYAAFD